MDEQAPADTEKSPDKIEVDNEHLIKIKDSLEYLGRAVPLMITKETQLSDIKKKCSLLLQLSQRLFPKPLAEADVSMINPLDIEEVKSKITAIDTAQFTDPALEPIIFRIEKAKRICMSGIDEILK